MEILGAHDHPSWDNMFPDVLAKIFSRLSLKEMLTIIPSVCKSWRCVSQDALCWQVINLDRWSVYPRSHCNAERMVEMLVNRSRGGLRKVSISYVGNDRILRCIAQSGQVLKGLYIYNSGVTDYAVNEVAPKLPNITHLDISACTNMSKTALEAFGCHCKFITHLKRNMYPSVSGMVHPNDDEALVIAQHMPQLEHLEISYTLLSNAGLKAILERCIHLTFLDLRGCPFLDIEEASVKECKKRVKVFLGPVVEDDHYTTDDNSPTCEDSDSSETQWCGSDMDGTGFALHEWEQDGTVCFSPGSPL